MLQVASLVGADPKEIIFTSGATEANNLAIKGVANFYKEKKNHVITLQTDHKCVLDSCRYLQHRGFKVTYLPVKKDGLVDMQLLADSITPETVMVSVMMINNEIGKLNGFQSPSIEDQSAVLLCRLVCCACITCEFVVMMLQMLLSIPSICLIP